MAALLVPVFTGLGLGATAAGVAASLTSALLLSTASRLLAGKPKISQSDVLRELSLPNSLPAKRFAYGFTRAPGTWTGITVINGILYGCLILNSRPSDGTGFKLLVDKREVTLTGTVTDFSVGATATNSPFAGYLKCWLGLGSQSGPPAQIMTEAGDATSTNDDRFWPSDRWRGQTVLWVRLDRGPAASRNDRWPRTPPEIEVEMRWSKVWDLRDGAQDPDDPATWIWSENQALCLLDAIRQNPMRRRALRQIMQDSFSEAADIADQNVALAAGGTVERYTVGGVLSWSGSAELQDQINPLVQAGAGTLVQAGGRLGYAPGAWRAPALTVTDVLDGQPFAFTRLQAGRDIPRAVRVSYVDPAAQYELSELVPDEVPGGAGTDGSDDGVETVDLSMVHEATQAMRVQRIMAQRYGMQRRLTGELPPTAMNVIAGANVTVALERTADARNGTYEVAQLHPAVWLESDEGVAFRMPATLRQTAESVYAWSTAYEQTVATKTFTPINLALPVPGTITATTGPGIDLNTGGTVIQRLKFAFDPAATTGIDGYECEFAEGSGPYQAAGNLSPDIRDGAGDVFAFVTPSVGAVVKFRVRSKLGTARSAWREITGVSIAFTVMGAAAVAEPGRARFTGTGPTPNLSGVKIYRAATGAGFGAAVAASAVLTVASGAAFDVVSGTVVTGAADFYILPVSTTGFEGTPSGPFALTIP